MQIPVVIFKRYYTSIKLVKHGEIAELGNAVFGNSRGQVKIPRGKGFEEELYRLFDAYAPDRDNSWREYGVDFENNIFSVMQYWWGDCTCGWDEIDNGHLPSCKLVKPNFLYKPTGYAIQWYKYPLRDSYANREISLSEFAKMIDNCIDSLDNGNQPMIFLLVQ
jgi:hypothetical protein